MSSIWIGLNWVVCFGFILDLFDIADDVAAVILWLLLETDVLLSQQNTVTAKGRPIRIV
jgi:hypothetical protein